MTDSHNSPKDSAKKAPKRRPGRDPVMDSASDSKAPERTASIEESETPVAVVDVESGIKSRPQTSEADAEIRSENHAESSSASGDDSPLKDSSKIEIHFTGSELIRAKFPKPFDVAEKIATDWVNDGRFEDLPLGHPLAEYFAAKGLRKAKEVEKKVMESPVTEKIAMNVLTYGMKAQEVINQIKAKVKK